MTHKFIYPGFILAHMLRDQLLRDPEENYVSVEDMNNAATRIKQKVPQVTPVIYERLVYSLTECYPAMFERVETSVAKFAMPILGFRRAEGSEKYFRGQYLEQVFHAQDDFGLSGEFSEVDMKKVLEAIAVSN